MSDEMTFEELSNFFPWVVTLVWRKSNGLLGSSECSGDLMETALAMAQHGAYERQCPAVITCIGPDGQAKELWRWDGKPETYDGPILGRLKLDEPQA